MKKMERGERRIGIGGRGEKKQKRKEKRVWVSTKLLKMSNGNGLIEVQRV